MQSVLEPIGPQHHHLIIQIEPSDYKPLIEDKLKKIRKTAQIKGFRQGAAPESMIRKLYAEELKVEQLQKLVNKAIDDYQKENNIQFMGDLMDVPEKSNTEDRDSFRFVYEVGTAPQINSTAFVANLTTKKYKIILDDKKIDDEVEHFRKQYGEPKEVSDHINPGDLVTIEAQEMDGEQLKENGWQTSFIAMADETMHPNLLEELTGKEAGHSFQFNIHEVEKDLQEKEIRKYILKIPEDRDAQIEVGDFFKGNIKEIKRKLPAELNEDLYKRAFGEHTEIVDEIKLREKFREDAENYFVDEAEKYFDLIVVQDLVKASGFELPDNFLKKWLSATFEGWKNKPEHELEHDYFHYREHMIWKLIRDAIIKENQIKIEYNDIVDAVMNEMAQYYPIHQLPEHMKADFVKRIIDNQEKAMKYLNIAQNNKAIDWIKTQFEPSLEDISLEEFREKVVHLNSHQH
ncbi:MAG: hypothetical protein IPM34_10360 [Saprospiraceae bacterium]|nr:hypothetical protein [Saprospiraceae bacterium]